MEAVTINGVQRLLGAAKTVGELLASLGVTPHKKAVEKNGEIIPGTLLDTTPVQPGDKIEIIQFVGGG